jgi:hypothetical protein
MRGRAIGDWKIKTIHPSPITYSPLPITSYRLYFLCEPSRNTSELLPSS